MKSFPRKSTPKVREGKVQRKNRTALSRGYKNYFQERPLIERERPGRGYRHVLLKRDVERFIGLLPDWEVLSLGLDAILLAPGEPSCHGWHSSGVVAVCAWERELFVEWEPEDVSAHREVLDRLYVPVEQQHQDAWVVNFTEVTVRAFQLMHVLLHELGHHHDRMTTRSQQRACRGEGYAESYANRYAERLLEAYAAEFGWS